MYTPESRQLLWISIPESTLTDLIARGHSNVSGGTETQGLDEISSIARDYANSRRHVTSSPDLDMLPTDAGCRPGRGNVSTLKQGQNSRHRGMAAAILFDLRLALRQSCTVKVVIANDFPGSARRHFLGCSARHPTLSSPWLDLQVGQQGPWSECALAWSPDSVQI